MLTTSSDHKICPKVLSSNIDSDTVVQKITIGRLASDGILWDGRSTKSVSAVDLPSYTMERVMPRLLYRKNGSRPIGLLNAAILAVLAVRPCDI